MAVENFTYVTFQKLVKGLLNRCFCPSFLYNNNLRNSDLNYKILRRICNQMETAIYYNYFSRMARLLKILFYVTILYHVLITLAAINYGTNLNSCGKFPSLTSWAFKVCLQSWSWASVGGIKRRHNWTTTHFSSLFICTLLMISFYC